MEIAIIGAGFSGLMTAYHLIKATKVPLTIHLIDEQATFGRGAAYRTSTLGHLLNVPAAKMSAIHDQPLHFRAWAHQQPSHQDIPIETLGKVFLPRKMYGEYLTAVWSEALASKRSDTTVQPIYDRARDIHKDHHKYIVHFRSHAPVSVDRVVLATGNEAPSNPAIPNQKFYQSEAYVQDPWSVDITKRIHPQRDIFILGNGLTMVDLVISIMNSGFSGQIHTLSPSGFAVLPHRYAHIDYPDFVAELKQPYRLEEIYRTARKHYRLLKKVGLSAEPLVDTLRPLTHTIWRALSLEDKRKFLQDIKTTWNKARHRLAPQLYDYIQSLRIQGKLVVYAAELLDIQEDHHGVVVTYLRKPKKHGRAAEMLRTGLVVNCTGPHVDLARSQDPLLQTLLAKGMICPDKLRMGMAVTDQWTLLDERGQADPNLYTLGGNLRGLLWETTAVPELRAQAAVLAKTILA